MRDDTCRAPRDRSEAKQAVRPKTAHSFKCLSGESRHLKAPRCASPERWGSAICLLLALAIGAGIAFVASGPTLTAVISIILAVGSLSAIAWGTMRLPMIPILRLALLASFSFRLEKNLFPVPTPHNDPPGLTISLMLILSVVLFVAHFLEQRQGGRREAVFPPNFALALAGTFTGCALSIVYGAEGWLGFYALFALASSFLMCFVVAAHFSKREALRSAVVLIAAAVALNGIIGLCQYWFGLFTNLAILGSGAPEAKNIVGESELSRINALLEKPNAFAWYLVTFAPVIISLLILRVEEFRWRERALFFVSSGLAIVSLVLTYARGSWVAFTISTLLMLVLCYWVLPVEKRGRFALRVAGLAVMIGVALLPLADSIYARLTEDDRGAAYVRLPLMQVAWEMIKDNPMLGVGLGSYEAEMGRYDETPEFVSQGFDWPVHNIFLHMAAEAGIPATLCFLLLVAIAFQKGKEVLSSNDPFLRALAIGLICGLLAFLWTGMKELGSFGSGAMRLCLLFCGLLIAVSRVHQHFAQKE